MSDSMNAGDVVIAGIGQIPAGEYWESTIHNLATRAIGAARRDACGMEPQALYVGNQLASMLSGQCNLGASLATHAGLEGVESFTVEAAGAAGAGALRIGCMAVASGYVDVALVVGVEKFTDKAGEAPREAVMHSLDYDYELHHGITPMNQAAILMQRYLNEYDLPASALEGFTSLARSNAENNPNAVIHSLRLSRNLALGVAPFVDGAAANTYPPGSCPEESDTSPGSCDSLKRGHRYTGTARSPQRPRFRYHRSFNRPCL